MPPRPTRSPAVAQRRLRILGAAAQCFAKSGFARTRIDDVAIAAGVSRALVYNHFGSKEDLARSVRDHMLDEWTSAVDRALADAETASDALAAWLRVNLTEDRRPLLTAIVAADAAPVLVDWDAAAERAMEVGMMQHLLDDKPYLDVSGEHHLRAAIELLVAGLHAPGPAAEGG